MTTAFFRAVSELHGMAHAFAVEVDIGFLDDCYVIELYQISPIFWRMLLATKPNLSKASTKNSAQVSTLPAFERKTNSPMTNCM